MNEIIRSLGFVQPGKCLRIRHNPNTAPLGKDLRFFLDKTTK